MVGSYGTAPVSAAWHRGSIRRLVPRQYPPPGTAAVSALPVETGTVSFAGVIPA